MTTKDCYHSEIICVQQAQTAMFNNLVKDIVAIHNPLIKGNSSVINQLVNDMEILSKRQDTLFDDTNFMLLMAALYNASCEEKVKCTVSQSSLAGLFGKDSKLLPEYEKLIVKYASQATRLFKTTQYSNKFDPIADKMNTCYQLINPKISNVIDITKK